MKTVYRTEQEKNELLLRLADIVNFIKDHPDYPVVIAKQNRTDTEEDSAMAAYLGVPELSRIALDEIGTLTMKREENWDSLEDKPETEKTIVIPVI